MAHGVSVVVGSACSLSTMCGVVCVSVWVCMWLLLEHASLHVSQAALEVVAFAYRVSVCKVCYVCGVYCVHFHRGVLPPL